MKTHVGTIQPDKAAIARLRARYGDKHIVIRAIRPMAPPSAVAESLPPVAADIAGDGAAPQMTAATAPTVTAPTPAAPRADLVLVPHGLAIPAGTPDIRSDEFKAAVGSVDATLKAFKPLVLTELPPAIQRALAWMRKGKDAAVAKDSRLAPSPEMAHDLRLLRFLIGHKFDPPKALDEYVAALKKRRELKLDALRDEIVASNGDFFAGRGLNLHRTHFHPKSAASDSLMPRLFVDFRPSAGGAYPLLLHREGHALAVDRAPDFDKITQVGAGEWNGAECAFAELQALVLDELSRRNATLMMICRVTDVLNRETALAKSLVPNPFAGSGEKQFKETGALTKMLYPTVIYKWFMVNLASAHLKKVQSAIATFGGRSKHKMIVCDTEFQKVVFPDINPSQLPAQFGGELPDAAFAQS